MRIIAGKAKGHRIKVPKTHSIRPATDKVREAIYNIIGSVEDLMVLDLFAGCGSVGLEAASRGAKQVVFVDARFDSIQLIKQNAQLVNLDSCCSTIKTSLPKGLAKLPKWTPERFDIVFIDPPYDKDLVSPTLKAIVDYKLVDADSLIIIEHSPREKPHSDALLLSDERHYGQTWISFFQFPSLK